MHSRAYVSNSVCSLRQCLQFETNMFVYLIFARFIPLARRQISVHSIALELVIGNNSGRFRGYFRRIFFNDLK
jgi:hypothetical protein